MKGKTIQELHLGDSASFAKTVSESDVYAYAGITGDLNPAHINAVEAKKGLFGRRVAHGMLTAGFVSAVLGMQLPGPGTIYLAQELKFRKPVYLGDTVTATLTVTEILEEKRLVKLSAVCVNQDGDTVLDGVATVRPPQA